MHCVSARMASRCSGIGLALAILWNAAACDRQPGQQSQTKSAAVQSRAALPAAQPPSSAPVEADVAPVTDLQPAGKVINSNDGVYAVKYLFDPAPPPMNEPFRITVEIIALDGPQPDEVVLSVDAAMPEHGHGMNVEPTVRPLPHNSFAIDNMLFHMAGRWEIYFDITRGGITSRAQDEITLE
ncbi:MAG TPA: hypothetical protein VMS30_08300 [Phycisphaerales bacterium]|nr:hypothetical protein [Phycisphaerales bacterium]